MLTRKLGTKKIKTPDGFLQRMLKWDPTRKMSTLVGSLCRSWCRISLCRRWSELGRGERKRDLAGYVTGGRDWVRMREREIRPKTHAHRPDLSLSQVVGVREREIRLETHAHRSDLSLLPEVGVGLRSRALDLSFPHRISLSPVVRPGECHGGVDGFFYLTVQVMWYFNNILIFLVLVDVSTDYWWA